MSGCDIFPTTGVRNGKCEKTQIGERLSSRRGNESQYNKDGDFSVRREGLYRRLDTGDCERSKVPPPSIQYYFNNKEGLYQACIEHMYVSAWETLGPVVLKAEALLTEKADANRFVEDIAKSWRPLRIFCLEGPMLLDEHCLSLSIVHHQIRQNIMSAEIQQWAVGFRIAALRSSLKLQEVACLKRHVRLFPRRLMGN